MRLSSTVIIQINGDVLLILRKGIPFKEHWALVGGAKRQDESFLDCGFREVHEEVGLFLRELKRVDEIMVCNEYGEQFSEVYAVKICREDLVKVKIGKEVLESGVFNHAKLPTPIVPFHKETIERYFNGAIK